MMHHHTGGLDSQNATSAIHRPKRHIRYGRALHLDLTNPSNVFLLNRLLLVGLVRTVVNLVY